MKISQSAIWRVASYLLVAALVLVSAGCNVQKPTPNAPGSGSTGSDGEQAIITYAGWEHQRQYFEELMAIFHEQNPEITVQFVNLNQFTSETVEADGNYRNLAQAADTFSLQGPFMMDVSHYFRDLRPLYEADPAFQPDDFWPGILASCEDPYGNVAGLPLNTSISGIFYDQAVFDKAGLAYPKPGWTLDDFQKAVIALAEPHGSKVKYGFYDQWDLNSSVLSPFVSKYLSTHGWEVDAAELHNEIKWYIDLSKAGMISGLMPYDGVSGEEMQSLWDERMMLMADEVYRPAMWSESLLSWVSPGDTEYDPNNPFFGMAIDRFGFAPFPIAADGSIQATSRGWVECAGISAGSPNPRAAWKWLNFLSRNWLVTDKTQVFEINRAPARQSVAEREGYWDLMPAKLVPTVRYILEHGLFDFAYPEQLGLINNILAKSIHQDADFVQLLESTLANRVDEPAPTPNPAPIVVATPVPPPAEGVARVKYHINSFYPNELDALNSLIEQYNQSSRDARISLYTEFHSDPSSDWLGAMSEEFDCFTTGTFMWQDLNANHILSLNSLLSSEPAAFSNDFAPEMLDRFRHEGNLLALPATSQLQMIAYNVDLLERRGLPMPSNDWTFGDFIELASAVASTSQADPTYGFLYSPYLEDDLLMAGKGFIWLDTESNPPRVNFDTPEMLEYLEWLVQLKEEGTIINQDNNWELVEQVRSAGQVAFWIATMGENMIPMYGMGEIPQYKIGMAPMPQFTTENRMTWWSNDRGHYISAKSANSKACWDWIKFMSDQPSLFGGVPARRSIAESPAWEASVGKEDAAAYRAAVANARAVEPVDVDMDLMQILWPISQWKYQLVVAAHEGKELKPLLIAQQQKAESYLDCALAMDTSKPFEELVEEIRVCAIEADPEGSW